MSTILQLQQSVLQDVVSMLDDNESLKKLRQFLRELKEERHAKSAAEEKEEILQDIRIGLQEAQQSTQGKVELQSARDFLNEIRG
ncbi:MAG: hypothetical protein K2O69_04185 [Odoribacter sp.]|nr:hypothetical protein [Odoribacter sp.]